MRIAETKVQAYRLDGHVSGLEINPESCTINGFSAPEKFALMPAISPYPAPDGGLQFTKPEAVDVPAIRLKDRVTQSDEMDNPSDHAKKFCEELGGKMVANRCQYTWDQWTCADKSRILLTDESGKKHCIKFPKGEGQYGGMRWQK